jgi:hypothetical protein
MKMNKTHRNILLVDVSLAGSIAAMSCASVADMSSSTQSTNTTPTPFTVQTPRPGMELTDTAERENPMTTVATILKIDPQKLQDAFNQARLEDGVVMPTPPFAGGVPVSAAANGGTFLPLLSGRGQPGEQPFTLEPSSKPLSRVAEILGISQMELENAFAQVGWQQ